MELCDLCELPDSDCGGDVSSFLFALLSDRDISTGQAEPNSFHFRFLVTLLVTRNCSCYSECILPLAQLELMSATTGDQGTEMKDSALRFPTYSFLDFTQLNSTSYKQMFTDAVIADFS